MTEILQFSVFYYQNQSKFPLNKKKKVDAGSFSLVNNGRIYKKKRKMQMETVEKMIIGVYLLLIIYDYIISNTYFSS